MGHVTRQMPYEVNYLCRSNWGRQGHLSKTHIFLVKVAPASFCWQCCSISAASISALLGVLIDHPWAVAATALLVLSTLPLSALRWGLILRVLGAPLPFMPLFHIQCIAMLSNQFLLGPGKRRCSARRLCLAGASRPDSGCRRVDRGRSGDRPVGAGCSRWPGDRAPMAAAPSSDGVPGVADAGGARFRHRVPRRDSAGRRAFGDPLALSSAGSLSALLSRCWSAPNGRSWRFIVARSFFSSRFFWHFIGHAVSVVAFTILALPMGIGSMTASDYATAVPLAFMVNAVPLTAGGLGVGEAAFDQLCRWLEPFSTGAAYASIFFAYRAVSTVVFLVGLVSLVVYRFEAASDAPE